MCLAMAVRIRIYRGVNVSNGNGKAGAITANYYKSPRQGNYIIDYGSDTDR